MKTKLFFTFLITGFVIIGFSCKKEEDKATLPKVTTSALIEITDTSATSGGTITSDGGADIVSSGVCWGTAENPTIADNFTTDIPSNKVFVSLIKGLKGGVNYYVRAYATNSVGTSYGEQVQLQTVIKSQTITMGASYANDIYYSLKNGIVATVDRTNWDIAFSVSTRSSSIIINEGANVALWVYPNAWSWATPSDTTGIKTWTSRVRNSNTDWEIGAFNANATTHPNYGWGNYNETSHNIVNADGGALYIIKLRNGSYKRIWIETKYSASQKYSFRYSNIDGSNPQVVTEMSLAGYKGNYGYYSLQDNQLIANREPDKAAWELLFTRWEDINNNQPYPVTGVLQNVGIKAVDLTTTDFVNIVYTTEQFSSEINTIGYDWKTPPMSGPWVVLNNKAYVVRNAAGKDYLIVFKTFAGSSTGTLSFDIREL